MNLERMVDESKISVGDNFTGTRNRRIPKDHSWQGAALRVAVIDMPFILAQRLDAGYRTMPPISLDTRCFEIMPLSDEYVEHVLADRNEPEKA